MFVGQQSSASPAQAGWAEQAAESESPGGTTGVGAGASTGCLVGAEVVVPVSTDCLFGALDGVPGSAALQVPASHIELEEHWQCLEHEPPSGTCVSPEGV